MEYSKTERPLRNDRLIAKMRAEWITNAELAFHTTISEVRISRIRCNRVQPSLSEKQAIARYLNEDTKQLFN